MLNELKVAVCEANRELASSGVVKLTWGNVSGIDRDTGRVVIKPSGVDYGDLKPESMVVLDLDGRVVDGGLKPSSDTPTHLVLYRAFGDIGGITHTHSIHATAFAQACRELPCLGTTHADQFPGSVPLARALTQQEVQEDYEGNTGRVIVERFAELDPMQMPAVLVAHHGAFTWGASASASLYNSVALEACAEMALATLRLDADSPGLPDHILRKHFTRKHGPDAYYGQQAPGAG